MDKEILKSQQVYSDLVKIIGSVAMCMEHRDQLLTKLQNYFGPEIVQGSLNEGEKIQKNSCGSDACQCKNN